MTLGILRSLGLRSGLENSGLSWNWVVLELRDPGVG